MEGLLDNKRWFVFDYHCVAGRPKMEDAVFEYAREILLYKIVYAKDLDGIVTLLNKKQQELYAENKRLKAVNVRYSKDFGYLYGPDNGKQFYIGQQWLKLRKIEGEFSL